MDQDAVHVHQPTSESRGPLGVNTDAPLVFVGIERSFSVAVRWVDQTLESTGSSDWPLGLSRSSNCLSAWRA